MADRGELGRAALHPPADLDAFGVVTTHALPREGAEAPRRDGIAPHFADGG